MTTFDVSILDETWECNAFEKIKYHNNVIDMGLNPRRMLLMHYLKHDNAESKVKILNQLKSDDNFIEFNDYRYLKKVFKVLKNQTYYIYWDGDFNLLHESEWTQSNSSHPETVYKDYTQCDCIFNSRCLIVRNNAESRVPKLLDTDVSIPEYKKYNYFGDELSTTLRQVLREFTTQTMFYNYGEQLQQPKMINKSLEFRMILDYCRGDKFYKMGADIFHESELPEISELLKLADERQCVLIAESEDIFDCIYVATLSESFCKYFRDEIYGELYNKLKDARADIKKDKPIRVVRRDNSLVRYG